MFEINGNDNGEDLKPERGFMTNTVMGVFALLAGHAVPGMDDLQARYMFAVMLRAERADAIREAARAWGEDPDGENWIGDNDKDYRNNLVSYADRVEANEVDA